MRRSSLQEQRRSYGCDRLGCRNWPCSRKRSRNWNGWQSQGNLRRLSRCCMRWCQPSSRREQQKREPMVPGWPGCSLKKRWEEQSVVITEEKAMKKAQRAVPARSLSRDLLPLWLIALLGAGCGTASQPQPTLLSQATTSPVSSEINRSLTSIALQTSFSSIEYRLGPEDLLQITLFNVPETEVGATPRRLEVRVSQQGVITLPLLGDITVAGLTTSALEQTLQERYKEYLRNPQIGVFVKEYRSQRISVIGQVRKPGVFELSGPKTLIDLLAMAGGVSEKAGS